MIFFFLEASTRAIYLQTTLQGWAQNNSVFYDQEAPQLSDKVLASGEEDPRIGTLQGQKYNVSHVVILGKSLSSHCLVNQSFSGTCHMEGLTSMC